MSFGWKLSQWKYATTLNRIDIIHSKSKDDLMGLKRIYKIKNNSYYIISRTFTPIRRGISQTPPPPPPMHT